MVRQKIWLLCGVFGMAVATWACGDSGSSGGGTGESTATACQDAQDNDGDGQTDCDDTDCQGFVFCEAVAEDTATACQDTQDNDGDGQTDCDDTDCQGFVFCATVTEDTAMACQDGQDNDDDGDTDCDDTDCQGFVFCQSPSEATSTACQDGQDNDNDGQTDCSDPDCQGFVFCQSDESTSALCQDSLDNDNDGYTDCADPDCQGFVFCYSLEETTAFTCQDGQDNDNDGLTDCDDTDCQGFVFCQSVESTSAACQDGQDNDNDGDTDCADTDCQGFVFCQAEESTASACQDGQDNDSDGQTDCDDTDCQGFVFCQSEESTSAACQDGQDNDSDGQTDCDDPDCQGFVFCLAGGEDSYSLCKDGRDNDSDGQTDCDDTDCWHWSYCQHYNGYPVVDAWNETWDGIERGAATWAEAKATCEALGGRLPTITELYRNNATTGTGNLSDSSATNYLWTLIACHSANARTTVRLSNGQVSYTAETASLHYRCVWPDSEGAGFDEYRCYGDPTEPCWSFGHVWNLDQWDRPAVTYAAAVNECAFYGASIPVVAEWGDVIHKGVPHTTNNWLWAGNAMYWYNGGYGQAIVRWTDQTAENWSYRSSTFGSLSGGTSAQRFRCVGLADPSSFQPTNSTCTGGCFAASDRRSPIVADSQDRVATRMAVAVEDCRDEDGDLANEADFTELVHEGWPGGTNAWNWLSDPLYWYSNGYGNALAKWSSAGVESWYWSSTTGARSAASSNRAYRCIWRAMGPAVPTCSATNIVTWTGTLYECSSGAPGTSNNQANVIEIVDDWGNAWDGIQRDHLPYDEAKSQCESLGGRLPTATEIWAVRSSSNPHNSIGDVTSTSYLWTKMATGDAGRRAVVRISDGASTNSQTSTAQYYRCIWPSRRGDVLAKNNCYGPPGDECFRISDGLIADSYDRVALDAATAISECLASGGHLADHREAIRLIHSGWPNGENQWLWLNEPMYWYSNNYGYPLMRWSGDGPADWEYSTGMSSPTNLRRFRCVYDQRLR